MESVKLLTESSNEFYHDNINKVVEIAGRTCYLSQDKIKDDSADKFISNVVNTFKHESIAGHLYFNFLFYFNSKSDAYKLSYDIFNITNGNVQMHVDDTYADLLIGMNWRSLKQAVDSGSDFGKFLYTMVAGNIINNALFPEKFENELFNRDFLHSYGIITWEFDPKISIYNQSIIDRFTVATFKFTGYNRTFSHQLVRHMGVGLKNVYSEMSQRYVNPTQKNINNLYSIPKPIRGTDLESSFITDIEYSMFTYRAWIDIMSKLKKTNPHSDFAKPSEVARDLLPNAMNTEIVTTMTIESWKHFIKMRTDKAAQYHIRDAAVKVKEQLTKGGLL